MGDYEGDTWYFSTAIDEARDENGNIIIFDLDTFRYGGSLLCYFSTTVEIKHAGIRVSLDKGGGIYRICIQFMHICCKFYK